MAPDASRIVPEPFLNGRTTAAKAQSHPTPRTPHTLTQPRLRQRPTPWSRKVLPLTHTGRCTRRERGETFAAKTPEAESAASESRSIEAATTWSPPPLLERDDVLSVLREPLLSFREVGHGALDASPERGNRPRRLYRHSESPVFRFLTPVSSRFGMVRPLFKIAKDVPDLV
jgi:hypothetical protein